MFGATGVATQETDLGGFDIIYGKRLPDAYTLNFKARLEKQYIIGGATVQYDWGPHYLVPSKALSDYSGRVVLREEFDEDLLRKQMEERRLRGSILRVTNLWYCRKKSSETWTKIGESSDILRDFPVTWDTTCLENGQYEIIGFMQAFVRVDDPVKWEEVTIANGEYQRFGYKPISVRRHLEKRVIGEQNIVEITVENRS